MPSLEGIIEEDIYVDIGAPDPIPIKLVKKAERRALIPKSTFKFTVCQKMSIAFACGAGTSVALYYFIQFVIACTKNPYL